MHGNCSKCIFVLTQVNYEKGRTVCNLCYNNLNLGFYENKICSYSTPKSDVITQTDILKKQDSSDKQTSFRKQTSSNKQDRSNKKDCPSKQNSSVNLENIDPDCLLEKFSKLYNSKYDSIENAQATREHAKEILIELLGVKEITRR